MKQTILILVMLAFAGCATPIYVTNWQQVQLGMTQSDVRHLLGEPDSVSDPLNITFNITANETNIPPELVKELAKSFNMTQNEVSNMFKESHSASAPLNPRVNITTDDTNIPPEVVKIVAKLFSGPLFDRNHERWIYGQDSFIGTPAKAFVVYFDDQGKVIDYRRPTKGRFRNMPKEDKLPTTGSNIFPNSRANPGSKR
ncbi:hypothetical protein ACFLQL_00930 [Verrucomicrobiota bacterium]